MKKIISMFAIVACAAIAFAQTSVTVDASGLLAEFKAGQAAADAKYKGKTFEVTDATIKLVDNASGKFTLLLGSNRSVAAGSDGILCQFSSGGDLAALAPGQNIVVAGTYQRFAGGKVMLGSAKIVRLVDPVLALPASLSLQAQPWDAAALYKEYVANPIAANRKFLSKTFKVAGTVRSVNKVGRTLAFVSASAESGVLCYFSPQGAAVLDGIKAGTQVVLQGTCDGKVSGYVSLLNCVPVK